MRRRHVLAAAASALAAGCGYSLQGRGITTDASVKRIGVPLFKDRTGKVGLDSFNVAPVGFSSDTGLTQATRYAISLTASVVYRKIGQADPIWSHDAFSQRDEYDMSESSQNYFDREGQSIERLSTAFARSLVAAMLEAF